MLSNRGFTSWISPIIIFLLTPPALGSFLLRIPSQSRTSSHRIITIMGCVILAFFTPFYVLPLGLNMIMQNGLAKS